MGALTVAMAKNAAELRSLSQLTGLSSDQLQRYQSAASAAGVGTDALTDAIEKLRDQAKEANRGNVEIQATFQQIGANAAEAARNAGPAFEKLLDILEQVPDAQTRITIAQNVLVDVSEESLKAILALTDANGKLRDSLNNASVAMDQQTVEELAAINREWNLGAERVTNFWKAIGVDLVRALQAAGDAISITYAKQLQATAATVAGTSSIRDQTAAIAELSRELVAIRIAAIQKGVSDELTNIAFKARNAAEAVVEFKRRMALDDDFFAAVGKSKQFNESLKALQEQITPKTRKGGTRKKDDKAEAFETSKDIRNLQEQLAKEELTREIALNKLREDAAREHKRALEDIERIADDRLIALIRNEADQRVITEQQAAEQIAAIRVAAFANRETQLKAEIDSVQNRLRVVNKLITEEGPSEVLMAQREELLAEEQSFLDQLKILQIRINTAHRTLAGRVESETCARSSTIRRRRSTRRAGASPINGLTARAAEFADGRIRLSFNV